MDDVIAAAFLSLRAQVGAQQAQIDALERLVMASLPGPKEERACEHEQCEDADSTMGNPRVRCLQCRAILTGAEAEARL